MNKQSDNKITPAQEFMNQYSDAIAQLTNDKNAKLLYGIDKKPNEDQRKTTYTLSNANATILAMKVSSSKHKKTAKYFLMISINNAGNPVKAKFSGETPKKIYRQLSEQYEVLLKKSVMQHPLKIASMVKGKIFIR